MATIPPKVWLGDDGILRIDYGMRPRIELDAIRFAYQEHLRIAPRPLPVLILGQGTMAATPEAEAFSSGPEVRAVSRAVAVVVSNQLARMAVRFYLRFRPPSYPFRAFANQEEALAWLHQYVVPPQAPEHATATSLE
ncbi:hypothetical protein [Chitinimonas sp.]|uniref:DUF7793 family protein n=1 Tax=Chitinimonas sp. TaxID=1934313 RepID=UPI0035B09AA2